mmetsp:Transcript_18827/g.29160  ORF Transcript_18827/g.29160 Transcript_18827/m.29160 type:complete len:82 (-) Transcript_18827:880-1125(-)
MAPDEKRTNRPGIDLKKWPGSNNESSSNQSEKAGDDKEEDYMVEDVDWSDDEEKQGGNVNAAPQNSINLDLDSNLQQDRRA